LEEFLYLVSNRLPSCSSLSADDNEHCARLEFAQQHVRKIFVGVGAEFVDEAGEALLRQLVGKTGGPRAGVKPRVCDETIVGGQRTEWHLSLLRAAGVRGKCSSAGARHRHFNVSLCQYIVCTSGGNFVPAAIMFMEALLSLEAEAKSLLSRKNRSYE